MPSTALSTSTPDIVGGPLAERIYRELRRAIVRCEFPPGQRLRVEELSRRWDASSSPVREALNRLSEQGFVRALENRGFRVAPLTVAGVSDLVRVRLLVECEALRDSIAHGDDTWESGMVAAAHALGRVEQRMGDGPVALNDDWSERHRAFHMALYAACRSPLLLELVGGLFDQAERYRRWSARHRTAPRRKHTEHQRLLAGALARDSNAAVGLLAQHISSTERQVAAALLSAGTGETQ
jgi:GntR family transcriptional regulator, carbon starvation induced regulator